MTIYQVLCLIGVPTLILAVFKYLWGQIKHNTEDSKALKAGIQALLRAQMISDFNKYSEKGYTTGTILKYGTNVDGETQLYSVLQNHTSQESWKPDTATSLYKAVGFNPSGVPIWTQPLGATDAYMKGDTVSHNEKLWVSDIDNNVWEPGVHGWTEKAA